MGYRSDVVMCMYAHQAEDFPALKVWFDQFEHDIKHRWDGYFTIETINSQQVILFDASDVKWYDSFDDVKFVENMLTQFRNTFQTNETEQYYNYEFIRVGEDTQDIEEDCGNSGFNVLHVDRSIQIG